MTTFEMPTMMTVDEVRAVLRFDHEKGVYSLIHHGRLRAVKVGNRYLIDRAELLRLLKGEDGGAA